MFMKYSTSKKILNLFIYDNDYDDFDFEPFFTTFFTTMMLISSTINVMPDARNAFLGKCHAGRTFRRENPFLGAAFLGKMQC